MKYKPSVTETQKNGTVPSIENDTSAHTEASFESVTAEKSEKNAPTPGSKKKKFPRELGEFLLRLTATVFIVWMMLTFLFGVYMCHSDTCYPMVKDGDLCVTWRPEAPTQGDLIVYQHNGETRFGRVAAISGDRVEIKDGVVWVNGCIAMQEMLSHPSQDAAKAKFPLTVPEKSVFILSDNLSDSNDSRLYGTIPLDECCGSVIFLMRRRGF